MTFVKIKLKQIKFVEILTTKRGKIMKIEILNDSIINSKADAIVNAANKYLSAGGGVCGAIFEKAGYDKLQAECNEIGYCETGYAVITKGYDLCKYIIHSVGPDYYFDPNPSELLKSAYLSSLKLADEKGLKSIAFPCISTGIFGYPLKEATKIALNTVLNFNSQNLETCYLYCYTQEEYEIYLEFYKENKKIST